METPRILGGILLALILLWPLAAQSEPKPRLSPEGCMTFAKVAFQIATERMQGDTLEGELKELENVRRHIDPAVFPLLRRLVVLVHTMKPGDPADMAMAVYMGCLNAQGDPDKFLPVERRM